jgi:dTDP-4-amino-4,6-dideoxygalactose transaminase
MGRYLIRLAYPSYDEEELLAVKEVLDSGFVAFGNKNSEVEEYLKRLTGRRYAVTTSSCSTGLMLSLMAYGIGERGGGSKEDRVIVPAMTYCATVNAVIWAGATPVFCDIDTDTGLIDVNSLFEIKDTRIKAVIPVLIGGRSKDFLNVACKEFSKKGWKVIVDAAQGIGLDLTIGDVAVLSFHSNKTVSCGEGGCVLTDDEKVYKFVELVRRQGRKDIMKKRFIKQNVISYGLKFVMSDINAAILLVQMKKLEKFIEERRRFAEMYFERLKDYRDDVSIVDAEKNVYSLYQVLVKRKRDDVANFMISRGIQVGWHYPILTDMKVYEKFPTIGNLYKARYWDRNVLSLPMHNKLTENDIDRVADVFIETIKRGCRGESI